MPKVIPPGLVFLADIKSGALLLMATCGILFVVLLLAYSIRRKTASSLIEMYKAGKRGDRFAQIGAFVGWLFVFFGVITVVLSLYVGLSIASIKPAAMSPLHFTPVGGMPTHDSTYVSISCRVGVPSDAVFARSLQFIG